MLPDVVRIEFDGETVYEGEAVTRTRGEELLSERAGSDRAQFSRLKSGSFGVLADGRRGRFWRECR